MLNWYQRKKRKIRKRYYAINISKISVLNEVEGIWCWVYLDEKKNENFQRKSMCTSIWMKERHTAWNYQTKQNKTPLQVKNSCRNIKTRINNKWNNLREYLKYVDNADISSSLSVNLSDF